MKVKRFFSRFFRRFLSYFLVFCFLFTSIFVFFSFNVSAVNVIYPVNGNFFNLTSTAQWSYTPVTSGINFSPVNGFFFESGSNGYPFFVFNNVRNHVSAAGTLLRMTANFNNYGLQLPNKFTFYGSFLVTSSTGVDFINEFAGLTFICGDFFSACKCYYYNSFLYFSVDVDLDNSVNLSNRSFSFQFNFRHAFNVFLYQNNLSILGYECFISTDNVVPVTSWWASPLNSSLGSGHIQLPSTDNHFVVGGQSLYSQMFSMESINSVSLYTTPYVTNVHDLDDPSNSAEPIFVDFSTVESRVNAQILGMTFTLPPTSDLNGYHGKVRFSIPLRYFNCQPSLVSVFRVHSSSSVITGDYSAVPFDFNVFCTDEILYDSNNESVYQAVNVKGLESSYSGVQGQGSFYQSYDGSVIVYNNDYNRSVAGDCFGVLTFDWDFADGFPYIFTTALYGGSGAPCIGVRDSSFSFSTPFDNYFDSFDDSSVSDVVSEIDVLMDNFYKNFVSMYQDFDDYLTYQNSLLEEILDVLSNLDTNVQDLMPQQEAEQLYDNNLSLDRSSQDVFGIENNSISSAGSEWNGIKSILGSSASAISQLAPSLLFCSNIIDSTVDGSSYLYVVFVVPVVIGLLFGIMHRIPNISRGVSHFKNRKGD